MPAGAPEDQGRPAGGEEAGGGAARRLPALQGAFPEPGLRRGAGYRKRAGFRQGCRGPGRPGGRGKGHGPRLRFHKADDLEQFESEKSWWATIEQIRATDYNLTAGRYYPHQAETVEHEKPEVLINRLLELEEEITEDMRQLLAMVSGNNFASSPQTSLNE